MQVNDETYRLTDSGGFDRRALIVGVLGLLVSVAGYLLQPERFFHAYLSAYVFWITIALGGLFFTMLHHLVDATWSVVLRRIVEQVMNTLPIFLILFLPLLLGFHELYHWSHQEAVAHDPLLQQKSAYLNIPFFLIRTAIYFLVWILLARSLQKSSLQQDSRHSESLTAKFRRVSAPGMLLFALTLTFMAFDWLMSLDAHWYSTIFGVYVFSGSVLAILAFITLVVMALRRSGILTEQITVEHYHDLGKLLFAFTVFWAYIAFSQFMLIWYGNIPEETVWFKHRFEGGWKIISFLILFGHFILPFLGLITRAAKRNVKVLTGMAIWILLMHWVDIFWLVIPNYSHTLSFSWMDLTLTLGIGGVTLWYFWNRLSSHPLIPVGDPKLEESIEFENQ